MKTYQDTGKTPKERAEALLAEMSLEEKLGQLVCYWPKQIEDKDGFAAYEQGAGVISATYMRMMTTLSECIAFQHTWQRRVMEKSEHHIPAIFHMEGLTGGTMPGAVSFPDGLGRASSFDPQLEQEIGDIISRQEATLGIGHIFAPVLDINRDPRHGRIGETYGEDASLASAMGSAYVKGIQQKRESGLRPEAVAKHFAGFHASMGGVQFAAFDASKATMRETYLKPFQAAITESGLSGVMPCYDPINGIPASASRELLTTELREEMGFDGLAVSDYDAIHNAFEYSGFGETVGDAGMRCLAAGLDVEEPGKEGFGEWMKEQFREGKADQRILDRAVLRVLTTKFRMGLFEHPLAMEEEEMAGIYHQEKDAPTAARSARESMVLLKNNGALPLTGKEKRIVVIGPHAVTARSLFGGYTHYGMAEGNLAMAHEAKAKETGIPCECIPGTGIQKSESEDYERLLQQHKPGIQNLVETLKRRLPSCDIVWAKGYEIAGDGEKLYEEALELARQADLVLLTLGGKHGMRRISTTGEGIDAADIGLPACQTGFLQQIARIDVPKVGIHFDGRPISSDAADEVLDALIEAWSPAEYGNEALADLLTGEVSPSGKLPVTVARSAGQIPIYYNLPKGSGFTQGGSIGCPEYVDMPHSPRYPFGFGLTYTTFAYRDLAVEEQGDDAQRVSFTVENTGSAEAEEIVQLYLQDVHSSMVRPVKELAGFGRIHLAPGESKRAELVLHHDQCAFIDADGAWKIEKGTIRVLVGASSEDIRLEGSFEIKEDRYIKGRNRHFYALIQSEQSRTDQTR